MGGVTAINDGRNWAGVMALRRYKEHRVRI